MTSIILNNSQNVCSFFSNRVLFYTFQKLRFFQRKVLRTLLTGRSNSGRFKTTCGEFSPLYSTTFNKKISPTSGLYFFVNGGNDEARLGLLAVRKLPFVKFCLRKISTHYSFLTGTAFRSLSFTSALPKSAELAKSDSRHYHFSH